MSMNETIQTISTRRSYREFTDKPVSTENLNLILQAGTFAPSAMNRQSAEIIVIKNETKREVLRALGMKLFDGRDPFYGAKEIILVAALKDSKCPIQDGSCVLQNMFLAAESLGIGSCWINCVEDIFQSPEGLELKHSLGISDELIIVGTCILGYPKKYPEYPKKRKAQYIRFVK